MVADMMIDVVTESRGRVPQRVAVRQTYARTGCAGDVSRCKIRCATIDGYCGASGPQRFFSSSVAVCCGAPKFGNGNAAKIPRVWSCIRCCMSMNSFALCSR